MKELTNRQIDAITATVAAQNNLDARSWCRAAIAADRALNAPADRDVMRQTVTDGMIAAYSTANDRYWRETDKWRNGTASEATRVGLEAALAVALADRNVMREALETIVQTHQMFCDHHVHVQAHSSELADIAWRALAAAPAPPDVLSTLRAEVEALTQYDDGLVVVGGEYVSVKHIDRAAVLALIDKIGGKI